MEYSPPPVSSVGHLLLVEQGFEPQTRARSNTWPCPRPEEIPQTSHNNLGQQNQHDGSNSELCQTNNSQLVVNKKSTSRRNAWGNMSYADLITQAITSSPEKRLTLSQIYDWMVTNVPYFKDKGDSNSSAGWKNSIRHNLSLHNRFVRVQNEGTGKSSWWMLNPDAKPGKAARRRATSMETSKYEKKRGRIRKKIEAMRNGTTVLDTPSPCSSLSEGLDIFPESPQVLGSYQLSPSDFRPRASSNASSCGRLSPILGVVNETNLDLHDNLYNYSSSQFGASVDRFGTEQLAGSLANTMKLTESTTLPNCFLPPTLNDYSNDSNNRSDIRLNFQNFQSAQVTSSEGPFRRLLNQHQQEGQGYYDFPTSSSSSVGESKQLVGASGGGGGELDFSLEQLGHFDCDVDEVLQTEINLGGELLPHDFSSFSAAPNHLHNGGSLLGSSISSLVHHHHNSSLNSHHQQNQGGHPSSSSSGGPPPLLLSPSVSAPVTTTSTSGYQLGRQWVH